MKLTHFTSSTKLFVFTTADVLTFRHRFSKIVEATAYGMPSVVAYQFFDCIVVSIFSLEIAFYPKAEGKDACSFGHTFLYTESSQAWFASNSSTGLFHLLVDVNLFCHLRSKWVQALWTIHTFDKQQFLKFNVTLWNWIFTRWWNRSPDKLV